MGSPRDDHDERLARIAAKLSELRTISAAANEEVIVATEQLVQHALDTQRETVAASVAAREARQRERSWRARHKR